VVERPQALQCVYNHARELVETAITCPARPMPVMIWGPPGVGKSDMMKSIATKYNMEMADIRLSSLDPVDLRGVPRITEEGKTQFCIPSFFPTKDVPTLMFFDELNQAPKSIQNAALQLILDRQIGEYRLPPSVRMVAAGNRMEDLCYVQPLSEALKTRMLHLELVPDLDEWLKWARVSGINATICGFLQFKTSLLCCKIEGSHTSPNPRTWHFASDLINGIDEDNLERIHGAMAMAVGLGPAQEYMSYRKVYAMFSIDEILNGKLPAFLIDKDKHADKSSSIKFALCSAMANAINHNKEKGKENNLLKFMKACDKEYVTLLFRNLTEEKSIALTENKAIKEYTFEIVDKVYSKI